jgi:hypothetical protein
MFERLMQRIMELFCCGTGDSTAPTADAARPGSLASRDGSANDQTSAQPQGPRDIALARLRGDATVAPASGLKDCFNLPKFILGTYIGPPLSPAR